MRPPATRRPEARSRPAAPRTILRYLREHGASFFAAIHQGTGGGFPQETVDALWELVWTGAVTNDTLHPLRAYVRTEDKRARAAPAAGVAQPFRSRRLVPRTAEGRWSLVDVPQDGQPSAADGMGAAMAQQLLDAARRRHARDRRGGSGRRRVLRRLSRC